VEFRLPAHDLGRAVHPPSRHASVTVRLDDDGDVRTFSDPLPPFLPNELYAPAGAGIYGGYTAVRFQAVPVTRLAREIEIGRVPRR
jgi:hypothetical protein